MENMYAKLDRIGDTIGSNCVIIYTQNPKTSEIEVVKIHKMTEQERQNKLTEYGLDS